ncbi:GntR family transcriptional regulator [Shewanella sp. JM162201]|uniref:GntR family transcriptional regulator n=1 Tax=Shewanella jiangmenensis TaxID=2837387 RepID=A0ABS5V6L4_9GAMM|nr:S1-like domain-containing RNA-binding protein [Shewanella jiangmenensis]MBT1445613.1 GntR family transcriptional regulator [Shewanella jiangmenensis]
MIQLGKTCRLAVVKQVSFGVYLNAGDYGQVLLPNKFVPAGTEVGQELTVFLYLDSEDTPIATTQKPLAEVGEFASLKVVSISGVGAFLDWGLDKDLLLPFAEQKRPAEEGKYQLVYVHINRADERIVASGKLDKFLDKTPARYRQGDEVSLVIGGRTELGYKAIVNNSHWGLIHHSDVFKPLRTGLKLKGFIKQLRHDGKIDLVLNKGTKDELDAHAIHILKKLNAAGGFLPLCDKTDADVIYAELGMSKKAFKKSIGGLFKQGKLRIEDDGLYLS